jgi:hypothetical protein
VLIRKFAGLSGFFYSLYLVDIISPQKIAFIISLFVPYQNALKFGSSAKAITFPCPNDATVTAGLSLILRRFSSDT